MPLLITKSNTTKSGIRKKTLSQTIEFGAMSLIAVTAMLICILSLVYLTHTNKTATRAYQLTQLKVERDRLIKENEAWNLKISKVQSLLTLQEDNKIQAMVESGVPHFVRGDTAVASK